MNRVLCLVLCSWLVLSGCVNPIASEQPTKVVATATAGAAVVPTETVAPAAVTPVTWKTCDTTITEDSDFECAVVTVPLDYAQPAGETIGIQIIRLPATDTGASASKGPLLVNPGGPGGSGIEWATRSTGGAVDLHEELGLTGFDIISFDPRGVGLSGGLFCQSDAEIDRYRYPDSTPDNATEAAFLNEARDAFATACKAKYGAALQHYSTTNTARDMDSIRQAIGADQISFIGFSYGTYLGGVYSNMFPDNVRAMVLDGAFQPEGDSLEERYTTQLIGFENAMDNWVTWCQNPQNECAFAAPDVSARWDALWQQFDDTPVTAKDGRVANQVTIEDATHNALYGRSWWPELGRALADAEQGKTERLWNIVDITDERDADGHYSSQESAFPLIMCASGIVYDAVADAEALLTKMRSISPRFTRDTTAENLAAEDDCYSLITPPAISPIGNPANAPIVVIGGLNDPATPMRWAEKMTTDLGPRARLVTYSGEGHTALLDATCVDTIARAVLIDGTLPTEPTTACAPDPDVAQPSWWGELPAAPAGATLFTSAKANELLILENREAYTSGYSFTGSAEDETARIDAALLDDGYRASSAFEDFYGADRGVYTKGTQRVIVVVIGAADLATEDWSYLQGEVEANEGMTFYLFFPE